MSAVRAQVAKDFSGAVSIRVRFAFRLSGSGQSASRSAARYRSTSSSVSRTPVTPGDRDGLDRDRLLRVAARRRRHRLAARRRAGRAAPGRRSTSKLAPISRMRAIWLSEPTRADRLRRLVASDALLSLGRRLRVEVARRRSSALRPSMAAVTVAAVRRDDRRRSGLRSSSAACLSWAIGCRGRRWGRPAHSGRSRRCRPAGS